MDPDDLANLEPYQRRRLLLDLVEVLPDAVITILLPLVDALSQVYQPPEEAC